MALSYIDAFAVKHFAGMWEAALFAALGTAAAGLMILTAHHIAGGKN